ncbi:N-6 DNA methylase [Helicobacter valdiviensis]|uniref:N-6 DNA methylase n=1 Tax=Helicobacter valdiviensis TaxID=1458358 RepID=A0A2W6NJ81_9HELI|nr:N-6 DNA methylase [Helicobacter valdiviensis]PZT48970.1 N-6 DNA methylase [Helicobacter valdiviensis]
MPCQITLQYKNDKIYSHIRKKYLVATPEEQVRQNFVCTLVNNYHYTLEQMDEEVKVKEGKGSVRADIVIWKSIKDKQDKKPPFIIIECKADSIHIKEDDYMQGESYARIVNAPFFVTHNSYETRFWRIKKDKMPGYRQEISNIPANNANEKDIDKLYNDLVAFKEDEFAALLHRCHNIIRNIDKLDPAAAFDEIAKILFMKVYVERTLLKGENKKFNLEWLQEARNYNAKPIENYFEEAKKEFAKDQIFLADEKINLKEHTILKIIEELQKYNLSITSTDIKGIAFERFLGRTFRGEIGQFFTPRSIVDFMVDMIEPKEGEIACDPASGSGGFLIRIFSKVREHIQQDIISKYESYKKELLGDKDKEKITEEEAKKLANKFKELQKDLEINIENPNSRLYKLSNFCIYGVDANERMARTSKMNMIMHGDGHGGIHHHNGLLNINGVFENRFDIILTNPPFGSQVEKADLVQNTDSQLEFRGENLKPRKGYEDYIEEYYQRYGTETYQNAQRKILDNIGKPIASLFELKENLESNKTEHLFINRCLDLLKPNGRLGIVLPEGVFNTPNALYVRKFVEGRAFVRAVISLPQETFTSSKASVKCSILFIQKFDEDSLNQWNSLLENHKNILRDDHKEKLQKLEEIISYRKQKGEKQAKFSAEDKKQAKKELKDLEEKIAKNAWQNAKNDFNYPIFMAEAEAVGITSTGETGENIPNELVDKVEINEKSNERIIIEKGIATHFKDFLQTYNIKWAKHD